jgi:hypothetical protein
MESKHHLWTELLYYLKYLSPLFLKKATKDWGVQFIRDEMLPTD